MPLHDNASEKKPSQPFLGIHFKCCNIYSRIYKNKKQTAYEGRCPRCGKMVICPIGEQGCSSRFFEVK